jgi:hypothetical protein
MVRMESMSEANKFDDLPPKTKAFLMGLRPDEVETLGDGIRLVNSIRTVGNFVKWLIVGILGLALGTVMFGESVAKILAWFRG